MRSLERSIEVTFCRLELRLVVNHSSSDCYTAVMSLSDETNITLFHTLLLR